MRRNRCEQGDDEIYNPEKMLVPPWQRCRVRLLGRCSVTARTEKTRKPSRHARFQLSAMFLNDSPTVHAVCGREVMRRGSVSRSSACTSASRSDRTPSVCTSASGDSSVCSARTCKGEIQTKNIIHDTPRRDAVIKIIVRLPGKFFLFLSSRHDGRVV